MYLKGILLLILISIGGLNADGLLEFDEELDTTISERMGETVILSCPVDSETCGDLHSLNWFKGERRIAVFLADGNITNVIADYKERVSIEQSPYRLIINDLQIDDEELYICDTTFFKPLDTCTATRGYRINLKVLVPPSEIVILDEKGDRIQNGTVLGPMQENHVLRSTCVVRNTRPQPSVGWFRGTKRLSTHSPTYDEYGGLYTASLELSLVLSRQDLASNIECRVESAALEKVITSHIEIDLQVRPTLIDLSGVEHHTVQGSKVILTCTVNGARPAANITWTNSTIVIEPEENDLTSIRTSAIEQNDGTYMTTSELIFTATRFENDMVFRCDADNVVLRDNREKPIYAMVTLEVMYPPVVKVSPDSIIVNASDTVLLNCEYVANPASLISVQWFKSGELVNVDSSSRFEGGNSENVALAIKETDNNDGGNYTCKLSNSIGVGVSGTQIELDVQYVPIVEVLMVPDGPVKENDETNVTLYCNIIDANPSTLSKVRWYANSTLLKELPDCNETNEDLCHIDPSKLLLESIGRGFFYNYSCEGFNAAGWGPRSEDKELVVLYEPGPATLKHYPPVAIKKKSVTFSCSVDDPGYPEKNRYRWFRGSRGPLQDIVIKEWTLERVGLDSRTNYSCYVYNDGGNGVAATIYLDVHAPPFFIKNLSPYTGTLFSSRNASLMCRIECVPRCNITWLKDGLEIDLKSNRYYVHEEYMAASPKTGDFESVMSILHFNMSAWPNNKFDFYADNANYSCVSSGNSVGPGVKSSTYFSIEYPPENSTVSHDIVQVVEETIPGRVLCTSKANPEPLYEWRFFNKTIARGNALIINSPMSRNDTGKYSCVAFNKHGATFAGTFIDVQYKPRCEIERREIDDEDTLICTAFGNPEESDFTWSIKNENDSVEALGNGKVIRNGSFFKLGQDYDITKTYRCIANNTVGAGTFCEIEVAVRPKRQLAWWQRWDRTTLIILVASILAILLAVIIICCIIICICRKRRRQDKLHGKSSSLGDPLTEPGEYENLPFHGLQTAPNKFTTTPINFNNTNVVRVAPRPKQLINNPTATEQQIKNKYNIKQQQQQQPKQQNLTQIQQQQSYNIIEVTQSHNSSCNNTLKSSISVGGSCSGSGSIGGYIKTNPHSTKLTYNLNTCFPKSYTEYYHQQNQNQHQNSNSNTIMTTNKPQQQQQQHQQHQHQQKFKTSNSQLINSIETADYPPYLVDGGVASSSSSSAAINNPFLATNFKKFNTSSNANTIVGGGNHLITDGNMSADGGGGSMQRKSTIGQKLTNQHDNNKKFYSLKFSGNKKLSGGLHLNAIKPRSLLPSGKCKRHHSFAGGGAGDVVEQQMNRQKSCMVGGQSKMRYYEPPVYENLTDSIQILECNIESHPIQPIVINKKKHHRRHRHQKMDDFNAIEPERLSIYRSDSGISNSSYECITPVPVPRIQQQQQQQFQRSSHLSTLTPSTGITSKSQSNPVYMNVAGNNNSGRSLTSSPSSKLVHSTIESQNELSSINTTNVDTASLISCNSSSIFNTINNRCSKHANSNYNSTTNNIDPRIQQQHHGTTTIKPPILLSSSTSTMNNPTNHNNPSTNNSNTNRKCKRRSQSACASQINVERAPNTNPFLATNNTSSSSSGCGSRNNSTINNSSNVGGGIETRRNYRSTGGSGNEDGGGGGGGGNDGKRGSFSTGCISTNTLASSTSASASAITSASTTAIRQSQHHKQQMLMSKELFPPTAATNQISDTQQNYCRKINYSSDNSLPITMPTMKTQTIINKSMKTKTGTSSSSIVTPTATTATATATAITKTRKQIANLQRTNDIVVGPQHIKKKYPGYTIRPMKLPLRKHHSFHFQPSQTVAGIKSKQHKQQTVANSYHPSSIGSGLIGSVGAAAAIGVGDGGGGPLVFRPFLNENSAFKPISPVGSIYNNSCGQPTSNSDFDSIVDCCSSSSSSVPRICGTSLKRHMSNVETYDSSRYNMANGLHSLSSPRLNRLIGIEHYDGAAALNYYDDNVDDNNDVDVDDDDDDDGDNGIIMSHHINANNIDIDDELDDDDDYIIAQDDDIPSSSSNSTIVGQRLVYVDLEPRSIHSGRSPVILLHDEPSTIVSDDLAINSDCEQLRLNNNRLRQQKSYSNSDGCGSSSNNSYNNIGGHFDSANSDDIDIATAAAASAAASSVGGGNSGIRGSDSGCNSVSDKYHRKYVSDRRLGGSYRDLGQTTTDDDNSSAIISATPTKRATQYAALRFNEVNI